MKIAVYAICCNEERMLPFFINYYKQFACDIIIWDNESTDNSVELLHSFGVEVHSWSSGGEIRDDIMLDVKNNFWKPSKGVHDWVIVADIDEIIYHSNIIDFLSKSPATVFKTAGYAMVSQSFPDISKGCITNQIKMGQPCGLYCKPSVFNPNSIEHMNFEMGCHVAKPTGKVRWHDCRELKLLHYHYMGLDNLLERRERLAKKLSSFNKQHNYGWEYLRSKREITDEFHRVFNCAERVIL